MELQEDFNEKKAEVEEYIQLLEDINSTMQEGTIFLTARHEYNGSKLCSISPQQQKIMFSCLYLQLYNLVESTVLGCISQLEQTIKQISMDNWLRLNIYLRKELIHSWVRKNGNGAEDTRGKAILELVDSMFIENGVIQFVFDKRRNGGNWDDKGIEEFARNIGMSLEIHHDLYQSTKKKLFNGQGGLSLIRAFRNELAHGGVSFVQCGERLDFSQLKSLAYIVFEYLQAVIQRFQIFINNQEYFLAVTPSAER